MGQEANIQDFTEQLETAELLDLFLCALADESSLSTKLDMESMAVIAK